MENESLIIKPRKLKGDDGYKVFSVRIKKEIVEKIDNISSKTGHSRNELIGTFIEYALSRCVIDTAEEE